MGIVLPQKVLDGQGDKFPTVIGGHNTGNQGWMGIIHADFSP